MVVEDFLQDPQVRRWLDGIEPAWTLLAFDSLRAPRQEPSAVQTAIQIANDLNADEIASSAVARNTLILLRQAIERGGLALTASGNLLRAVVAEMRRLTEWPGYGQADAFGSIKSSTSQTSCRCTSFDCSRRQPNSFASSAASW
jgi:hypothetical protein